MESDEFSKIMCSLDKIETIANVLNQAMLDDDEFSNIDNKNLCSIILREINYTKSKLQKVKACR